MVDQAEIHKMALSEDAFEREDAAYQFFFDFKELPDKEQAWKDLSQLINDKIINVRRSATEALGVVFPYIPDKLDAWNNLHRLTWDMEYIIRIFAAEAIGVAFLHIPDKKQASDDLYRLTLDEKRIVRPTAFLSLGRASIFKATYAENKETFQKNLEEAIKYFEKSLTHLFFSNSARFCLPFYRSFYTLTFKTGDADTEVHQYLAEARDAVKGSKSREKLLEAVENLGNALKEAQSLQYKDFNSIKSDLNAYRRYCERACELLDTTEEIAPDASKLIRKGLPIIDERIKGILGEIQEKAKALCKNTKDTPFENLGTDVNRAGQCLAQIRDPISLEKRVHNMQTALSAICARMPVEERGNACELLRKANDEQYVEDKLELINMVLSKIPSQIGNVTNIQVSNSNNVQITTANGTTQKMSIEIPEDKTIK